MTDIFGVDSDWMKEQPLHPDLEGSITRGAFGEMVHHPLVIQPMSMGRTRCAMVNANYEQKKAQLEEATAKHDFHRMVMLHERPYRFDALTLCIDNDLPVDSIDYWQLVAKVWMDSENIHENYDAWRAIWHAEDRSHNRHHVMREEDRAAFSAMRSRIKVYRGYSNYGRGERGLSWTTSRKQAIWFANRFEAYKGSGMVGTGWVAKENVYAYLNGRGEAEMVINPDVIEKWEYVTI